MAVELTLVVVLAAVLDRLVRELPARVHPVVVFGRLVDRADREWSRPRLAGVAVALALPVLPTAVAFGVVSVAVAVHPLLGVLAAGAALFTTTSLQMLLEEAAGVIEASSTDPAAARERLPALAGRDPADLSPDLLRSAAVESASENLADGLVAPLLAFALLAPVSLPLGAAAAAWLKAVNTLDSMLGYPSKPHGWASARLDDLVMWVPARVSALLLSAAALSPDPVLTARRWRGETASPNSGWPMATAAGALQVRLEKPDAYVLNELASLPTTEQAHRGVALVGRAGVLAYAIAALSGVIAWLP
ncbi:adenosylcobinamide-phosphate synthase CbiB [Natranaeroarchaeum sulfidigenes]|uniref:Probable cobalamin biosynthesis protein CobD n=1 Tax=Natranaeroarchaeum sulfidigenes TaxID=2784880 RepID=A0A897MSI7_9EURY|nr:Cobalamin biosynthesis protein CobD/CbiB [Natranaeroarchaeum sulfidigenes]